MQRSLSIEAKSSVLIKASPEEVFSYIKDLKYHYLWNPRLRNLSSTDELKLGSSYESESVFIRDIKIVTKNEVTKYVPNKQIGLRNRYGMITYDAEINLRRRGRLTNVSCTIDILTSSQAFGLTLPVLKQLAKRELQYDLDSLKIAVESDFASQFEKA